MRVYLSGGFRSGWQDRAIGMLEGCEILDPRQLPQDDLRETFWVEMQEIGQCDVLLAYIEPGFCPIGLCAEVGYAYAVGTRVVMCYAPGVERVSGHEWLEGAAEGAVYDGLDAGVESVNGGL